MQKKSTQKNRAGRVMVAAFFDRDVHAAIKIRAVHEGTTIQALLERAVSNLLARQVDLDPPARPTPGSQLTRIELHLTVPGKLAKDMQDRLLAQADEFENAHKVSVVDLDMTIAPVVRP